METRVRIVDDLELRSVPHQVTHSRLLTAQFVAATGQALALAAVFFPAWSFGGVLPRSLPWLYPALAAALACWLISHRLARQTRCRLPGTCWLLALALGLGGLQLVPLPPAALARLSPGGAQFRAELLPATPSGERRAAPLSLEPAATRQDIATLALVTLAFGLGATLFADEKARRFLCLAIAVQGAAVAFFSLTQLLTRQAASAANWRIAFHSDSWFGPFINRNNEGGYLNLCLGGALALLLWTMRRDDHLPEAASPRVNASPRERLMQSLLLPLGHLQANVLFSLALCGLIVAEIFCSLSRGAIVSMLVGLLAAVWAVGRAGRRAARLWPLGLALAAGLALVAWSGGRDRVQRRLESLLTPAAYNLGRIPHWCDGLRAAADFWPLGCGLGAYRRVYPAYQHRSDIYWYQHAENQPLEALVVGGLPGLLLLSAAAVLTVAAARRRLRGSPSGWPSDFAVGMVFLLTAQFLHGLVDFGLFLPAGALLLALICGAICAPACDATTPGGGKRRKSTLGGAALLLAIVGVAAWGWWEIRRAAAVDDARHATRKETDASQPQVEPTRRALARMTAATALRPDDADGQFQTAVLWVQAYRAEALAQLRKEYPHADPKRLDELTSLINLFRRAEEFRRAGNHADLQRLRREPLIVTHLARAEQHAELARNACPNMPEPHLLLAQLSVLRGDGDPQPHLRRVEAAAPSYGPMLHRCATLELLAGRVDEALRVWRLAIASDEDYLAPQAAAACDGAIPPEQIVDRLLPDSPGLLVRLARDYARDARHARLRQLLMDKAVRLLPHAALARGERERLEAVVASLEKRNARAIELYQAAVRLRPTEAAWRYELAQLLFQEGRWDAAIDEARMCAITDPRNPRYRILLEQIHETRLRSEFDLRKLPKP